MKKENDVDINAGHSLYKDWLNSAAVSKGIKKQIVNEIKTEARAEERKKVIDEVLKIIVGWECVDDYCDMDLLEDAINALREGKQGI